MKVKYVTEYTKNYAYNLPFVLFCHRLGFCRFYPYPLGLLHDFTSHVSGYFTGTGAII